MLKSVLVSDVWMAAMCKGVKGVFAGAGTWLKDVKLVSGVWCRTKEGREEA